MMRLIEWIFMPRAQLHNIENEFRQLTLISFSLSLIYRLQVVLQALGPKEFDVLMSGESQLSD